MSFLIQLISSFAHKSNTLLFRSFCLRVPLCFDWEWRFFCENDFYWPALRHHFFLCMSTSFAQKFSAVVFGRWWSVGFHSDMFQVLWMWFAKHYFDFSSLWYFAAPVWWGIIFLSQLILCSAPNSTTSGFGSFGFWVFLCFQYDILFCGFYYTARVWCTMVFLLSLNSFRSEVFSFWKLKLFWDLNDSTLVYFKSCECDALCITSIFHECDVVPPQDDGIWSSCGSWLPVLLTARTHWLLEVFAFSVPTCFSYDLLRFFCDSFNHLLQFDTP